MADTWFDLAPLIESALADPAVVQKIVRAIDVPSLVASDEVKQQLFRIVADPAVQQQLLSRLDVSALINNPAVSQQLGMHLKCADQAQESSGPGSYTGNKQPCLPGVHPSSRPPTFDQLRG